MPLSCCHFYLNCYFLLIYYWPRRVIVVSSKGSGVRPPIHSEWVPFNYLLKHWQIETDLIVLSLADQVIARFAVGKSDPHHKEDSFGYVFGNVTKHLDPHEKIRSQTNYAMILVNRELYMKIKNIYDDYKRDNKVIDKSAKSHNGFCEPVLSVIDDKAYDQTCRPNNTLDVIRYVPCHEGALCDGAIKSSQIVQNYQFTYVIEDQKEPTYESFVLFDMILNRFTQLYSMHFLSITITIIVSLSISFAS